jgi:hypothetical protein
MVQKMAQFTQAQAQALAEEIRNQYPSLPVWVTHLEAEKYGEEQNMVALMVNNHAITVFQSYESWQGFLALAHMVAQQEADNALQESLNEQALEFSK